MPIIAVDKPLKLTSHDVVHRARKLRNTRRIGHTGTLDPLATGVLVLCIDDSTKVVQFMEHDSKDYLAWVCLGASTVTLDAEGKIDMQERVDLPSTEKIHEALYSFLGRIKQVPPQYSAIQVGGKRAYAVARAGGNLDLPAREIDIHSLELLGAYESLQESPKTFCPSTWSAAETGVSFVLPQPIGVFPTLLVRASVGSGTYLRSLARDIGAMLGFPAHLGGLVRTRVGKYNLRGAATLDNLSAAVGISDLEALDFPCIEASPALALALRQGKKPSNTALGRHTVTLGGQLVAVVDGNGEYLKVVRVWNY